MAILNFPDNPHTGDQYTGDNGTTYVYDGVKWLGTAGSGTSGTNSIVNNGHTVQVDATGKLVTPAFSFPNAVGATGMVLTWPGSGNTLVWSNQSGSGGGGSPGQAATITVGTVTTGSPGSGVNVSNVGTSTDAVFNFRIPKGDKGDTGSKGDQGDPGIDSSIAVGTVTTGLAGTNATINNTGTTHAAVFNFTIPRGNQGVPGRDGTNGTNGTNGQNGRNGTDGAPGAKGDTGAQGISVVLQGTKATIADLPAAPTNPNDFAGYAWIVTTGDSTHLNGSLWFWNLELAQWEDIGKIVGPEGPRGQAGNNGQNGLDGRDGTNGTNGQGFTYRGEWLDTVGYAPYDVVNYLGGSYVAINGNEDTPPSNTEYWDIIAVRAQENKLVNNGYNFTLGVDGTINFDPASNGKGVLQTTADLWFNADGAIYNFGANGDLTFPSNSGGIEYPVNGEWNIHRADGKVYIGSVDDMAYIDTYDANIGVRLRANDNDWIFDPSGKLTLPGTIKAQDGNDLNLIAWNPTVDNVPGGVTISLQNRDLATGGRNTKLDVAPNNITLITDFDGNRKTWTFGADGTLKLPVGGDIVDSNGTSVLGGGSGTIWTNDANGCLRVELSDTGFQAFTDATHLDLQDGGQWNVGSYQNNTSIGNDGFANPRDLWLRSGSATFITTDLDTVTDGNQWMFSNNVLQTNGKAKIDLWKDESRLGAPAPLGTTDTITLWNFNGENDVGELYNYAIGVEGSHVWFATDTDPTNSNGGFKFYSRGEEALKIGSDGSFVKADGIKLVTGRGTLAIGTNMEVPGYAQHLHIAFDSSNVNPPASDLFLGDDYNYVKLPGYELNPADYGVEIGANDRDGGNQHVWRFSTDGTTLFPDDTLAVGDRSLDITAGNYININSDTFIQTQYTNPDVQFVPGEVLGAGFFAGPLGVNDKVGAAIFSAYTPDGEHVEEVSSWIVNNQGNLETLVGRIDIQTNEYTEHTADIVDRFGNSIIHPVASDSPPQDSNDGRLWFKSDEARLYIMYNSQWIDASPTVIPPPNVTPTFETVTFSDDTVQTTAWLGTYSYNDLTDKPGAPAVIDGGNAYSALLPV